MRCKRTAVVLCAAWLVGGCTRSEPSLVPLGHGALSQAQRDAEAAPDASSRKAPPPRPARPARPALHPPSISSTVRTDMLDSGLKTDAGVETAPLGTAKNGPIDAGVSTPEDWLGLYRGNDTTTFKSPDQPERRFDDPKAKIRVERGTKGRLDFVLVDSSNDKDMCKLTATVEADTVEADTATIEPGQSCFLDTDEEMTAKSLPGKAIRKDRHLTLDLVLDTVVVTDEGRTDGTIDYHFEGQR